MNRAVGALVAGVLAGVAGIAMQGGVLAQQRNDPVARDQPSCSAGSSATLARYKTGKGEALAAAIPKPLTKKPGDGERGLEALIDPEQGDCLACHHIAKVLAKADESDPESVRTYGNHGEIGPPLNGVGARYTTAELRMIVVDPRKAFPDLDTVMPAYHARPGNKDVTKACQGRVMLPAQAVEDIVAYLEGLK